METTSSVRRRSQKSADRRDRLAESALTTLGELGYARTSLRDIAANSEFTHGVIHYYFADKTELITYCVRHYKSQCVTRYDDLTESATDADELCALFADKLCETLVDDSAMHRLWYELRAASMYEAVLRDDVLMIDQTLEVMIWRVVERYAELASRVLAVDSAMAYALLDGLFERALFRYLTLPHDSVDIASAPDCSAAGPTATERSRVADLRNQVIALLPTFVA